MVSHPGSHRAWGGLTSVIGVAARAITLSQPSSHVEPSNIINHWLHSSSSLERGNIFAVFFCRNTARDQQRRSSQPTSTNTTTVGGPIHTYGDVAGVLAGFMQLPVENMKEMVDEYQETNVTPLVMGMLLAFVIVCRWCYCHCQRMQ